MPDARSRERFPSLLLFALVLSAINAVFSGSLALRFARRAASGVGDVAMHTESAWWYAGISAVTVFVGAGLALRLSRRLADRRWSLSDSGAADSARN